MRKFKPTILEVVRKTPGGLHSWVKAMGREGYILIRKQNRNITLKKEISPELHELISKQKLIPWWRGLLNFIFRR